MEKTKKVTAAGIMNIISGCYGIGIGASFAFSGGLAGQMYGLGETLSAIGGGLIGLGVVALIGGIFALMRKVWGLALAGSILAIPLLPVGTVLGIISLVFVSKRKSEFS